MAPPSTPVARGAIFASCGCQLHDEDGVAVRYRIETCDAVDGFSNAVAYANFCTACAERLKASEDWIETDEQADEWLRSGRKE